MKNSSNLDEVSEFVLSPVSIVKFIQESWKQILLAGLAGGCLGLGWLFFIDTYKVKLVLHNKIDVTSKSLGLDMLSWIVLKKSLPELANKKMLDENLSDDQKVIYRLISSPQWWSKNVIENYALVKSETRGVGRNEAIDDALNRLDSISVFISGKNKDESEKNADIVSLFIISGAIFINTKALIDTLQRDVATLASSTNLELSKLENELSYLQERIKNLNSAQDKFHKRMEMSNQNFNSIQGNFDYLSIQKSLITADNDLYMVNEQIKRLKEVKAELIIRSKFSQFISSLVVKESDGSVLLKGLFTAIKDLRKEISQNDRIGNLALDKIDGDLLKIQSRFNDGIEVVKYPHLNEKDPVKFIVGGFLIGSFLILVFLLALKNAGFFNVKRCFNHILS